MRVAQIDRQTKTVVNVVVLDDLSQMHEGFDAVQSDTANIGDVWDGANFNPPPPPAPVVPQQVSKAQGKIALNNAGLLTQIDAFVAASNNPVLKIAWSDTDYFYRNGVFVTTLAVQFNLTDAQLDQLFIAAAAIQL